jgi:hypothetical protein
MEASRGGESRVEERRGELRVSNAQRTTHSGSHGQLWACCLSVCVSVCVSVRADAEVDKLGRTARSSGAG